MEISVLFSAQLKSTTVQEAQDSEMRSELWRR